MITFTTRLIEYGKKNLNGRTYLPTETDWDTDRVIIGTIESMDTYTIPLNKVAAHAKIYSKPDGVYADITTLGPNASVFESLLNEGFTVVPSGAGRVDADGIIRGYKLISFFLTKEPSFI